MEVTFPKLGWEFTIDNVAFTVFGKDIYWYAVIIAMGFLLALTYVFFNIKKFDVEIDPLIDVAIVGLLAAILGCRTYYVIFNFNSVFVPGETYEIWGSQILGNIVKFLAVWEGGLAIYGGIIAAFAVGFFMCKRKKMNVFSTFDLASIGFLIGQGVGRWGNFMNQEAFGTPTDSVFGMASINTGSVPVHPCFLYESIWCLTGVLILHFINKHFKKFDGQIFLLYLIWYGMGRFWIEGLRTDSLWLIPDVIRVSQLVAGLCVLAGTGLLLWKLIPIIKSEKKH